MCTLKFPGKDHYNELFGLVQLDRTSQSCRDLELNILEKHQRKKPFRKVKESDEKNTEVVALNELFGIDGPCDKNGIVDEEGILTKAPPGGFPRLRENDDSALMESFGPLHPINRGNYFNLDVVDQTEEV